ncbi:ABC transporter ATP-binding protein [Halobacterium sp. CBA1126]|uniref:ABC transporter ATP-binding protein n=1 Tax=Halobacterium TaxID=2239 RepID=UPI0012FACDFA|nr:ABC transporter ATP-binding protein [Halobacterium sp. CBA1126]MUV59437.1 ATP-binding cassette domain-containing protein [Halobacterium sp. CBA1126]
MDVESDTPLSLQGITKQYESLTAVNSIDLEVEAGEFVVIVGPSGCGKSTTLRMIAGLEDITDGDLYFGDERVNDVAPKDRNVAMVFQNYALYPHMSARRNMIFGINAGTDSYSDEEIDNAVQDAAETLGITDLLDRMPNQLSGGERQRVALGRALIRDPDVLLLDEPLANLDAKLRTEMRTELDRIHQQFGATTIYVTHNQTEAMTLGDRVVVLNNGEIQQVDSPQTLYDFPKNRFVAEFIGSPTINLLPISLTHADGHVYAERHGTEDDFRIDLGQSEDFPSTDRSEAILGIRPEDLSLEHNTTYNHPTPLFLTVETTEPLGNSMVVYGTIADQEVKVKVDAHASVSVGNTLSLVCDPDRIHLFDTETGDVFHHSANTNPT